MRLNPFHVIIPFPARQCCQYNSLSGAGDGTGRGMPECGHPRRGEPLHHPEVFYQFLVSFIYLNILSSLRKMYNCKKGYHLSIYGLYF